MWEWQCVTWPLTMHKKKNIVRKVGPMFDAHIFTGIYYVTPCFTTVTWSGRYPVYGHYIMDMPEVGTIGQLGECHIGLSCMGGFLHGIGKCIWTHLTTWVPAVIQGLVDVGRMDCSSLAAHSSNINQSKESLCSSEPLQDIQIPMNPFCAKNFKMNSNMVPYGDHGTERVNIAAIHSEYNKTQPDTNLCFLVPHSDFNSNDLLCLIYF